MVYKATALPLIFLLRSACCRSVASNCRPGLVSSQYLIKYCEDTSPGRQFEAAQHGDQGTHLEGSSTCHINKEILSDACHEQGQLLLVPLGRKRPCRLHTAVKMRLQMSTAL
eukprot:1152708-Pelagomonas_calceolata.AAC.4